MNIFEEKKISQEVMNDLSELVNKMSSLGLGGGHKKEASLSKVKSVHEKEAILRQVKAVENALEDLSGVSILAILEVAKRKKQEFIRISRELVPSALQEAGMKSLELINGHTIVLNDVIEASIADKNYLIARNNMIKEEQKILLENKEGSKEEVAEALEEATRIIDSYFKNQLVVDSPDDELKELLLENEFEYETKYSIHWQTLRKYCSKQKEAGKNIPEGISVFEYTEAVLK